jgi:hypothetical protein
MLALMSLTGRELNLEKDKFSLNVIMELTAFIRLIPNWVDEHGDVCLV